VTISHQIACSGRPLPTGPEIGVSDPSWFRLNGCTALAVSVAPVPKTSVSSS